MRRGSRLLIAAASTTALTQIALASDLPVKAPPAPVAAPYSWTGWYIGLNAGALWGNSDVTSSAPCTATTTPPAYFCGAAGVSVGAANGAAVGAAGTGSLSDSGFTGGVQTGYNWQNGNIVLGLEADFNAFHFSASRFVTANYPVGGLQVGPADTFTVGTSTKANWLFTGRGRLGWTVAPNLLAYATGGLALTELKVGNLFSDSRGASGGSSASATKAGWVVGGGLEWAFAKNWSAKVEYLYLNFGTVSVNALIVSPIPTGTVAYSQNINTSADLTAQIARAGINYKF
jgi:outer membrane immunogenic protein